MFSRIGVLVVVVGGDCRGWGRSKWGKKGRKKVGRDTTFDEICGFGGGKRLFFFGRGGEREDGI